MELRHVRSFLRLAQELHFGRTAALLNLSPPALSQHIKSLERDLHAQLFIRDRRSVRLSEAGEAFLPHAQRLVRTADSAMEEMRSITEGSAGIIRIGLFVNNAAELTVPILQRFRAALPNVQITFVPLDFAGQISGILEDRVDVAFVRPPIKNESIDVRVLGYEPRAALFSKSSELAAAESVTFDDLAEQRFIDAAALSTPTDWTNFWLLMNERNEPLPRRASEARLEDFEAVTMDIAFNEKTTTIPLSVAREMKDGLVTAVPIDGLGCELAVATHVQASPISERFCAIAEETARSLLSLVPGAVPAKP